MAQSLMQNNEMLIYEMEVDEDDGFHKQNLSTTSKSDQYKNTLDSSDISHHNTIQTLPQTQIIKISPHLQKDEIQLNQNQLIHNPNPLPKNHQNFTFKHDEEDSQNQENDQFQLDSPIKFKKPRRKRLNSPLKRKKVLEEHIIDYEHAEYIKSYQDASKHHSLPNCNQIQQTNTNQIPEIQTTQKNQNYQNVSKINNWLEMQDSQRYFGLKKEEITIHESSENKNLTRRNFHSKREKREKSVREEKEIESCQILMDDCSADSEEYTGSQEEEEEIYNNECSEEEKEIMFHQNKYKKTQLNPIKVLKQLPKQIFVQTSLQSLVMRPVPTGLKMSCNFTIESKYLGMSKQYNLVLRQTGRTVLSAKKQHFSFSGSKFIISSNENFISKRKENNFWIGRLQSNFAGTKYELTQRDFSNSQAKSSKHEDNEDEIGEYEESLAAVISFENNLWGFSGIRKMDLLKLDDSKLTQKDLLRGTTLWDILERNEVSKLTKIETTKPEYNKKTKRYNLNFDNKVKIPSAKNLILHWKVPETNSVNEKKIRTKLVNSFSNIEEKCWEESTQLKSGLQTNIETVQKSEKKQKSEKMQCLLIGKQSQKEYLVEVGHPLSLYEAFGACLANEDTKYLVN